MIQIINAQLSNNSNGAVLNTECLTGLTATPTNSEILQAVINLLCNLNTTVAAFPTTYVSLTALPGLVTNIVNGVIGATNFNSRMVPFAALP